jgi:hypothetical protein
MKINAVYQLLDEPSVYLSTGPALWNRLPVSKKRGFLLCHPMWFFGPNSARQYRSLAAALLQKNLRLVVLHNSKIEATVGALSGLPSHLLNQNMHVCEHWFKPRDVPVAFDALYTAAAAPYKRIDLALDVPRLFVLTYFWPDRRDEKGKWRLELLDRRLAGVKHNQDRVESQDVPNVISSARCGLALSRIEGAMWASMEYLLCGRPVVTTWNLGGRDFYLNESNSVRVRATRASVKAGVLAAPARCAAGPEIRRGALRQIGDQRGKFTELVSRLTGLRDLDSISQRWWSAPDGIHAHRII